MNEEIIENKSSFYISNNNKIWNLKIALCHILIDVIINLYLCIFKMIWLRIVGNALFLIKFCILIVPWFFKDKKNTWFIEKKLREENIIINKERRILNSKNKSKSSENMTASNTIAIQWIWGIIVRDRGILWMCNVYNTFNSL